MYINQTTIAWQELNAMHLQAWINSFLATVHQLVGATKWNTNANQISADNGMAWCQYQWHMHWQAC